jgi:hypothetical protein
MIRVTLEVDGYGHDYKVVRATEHFGPEPASEELRKLIRGAEASMIAAISTAPSNE